jgi:hypothetical protein
MRCLMGLSALIAAGILFTHPAWAKARGAEQVSRQGAKNICRGHNPDSSGSCVWCGKVACGFVTCTDKYGCKVGVVKIFQPSQPRAPGLRLPVRTVKHPPVMAAPPSRSPASGNGAGFNHSGRYR